MSGFFFNEYPYTDFHELNLSWVIKKIIELNETVKNFVSLNTIKYADPIQWDITSQYEKNTVVVDPQTGTAYISVVPVPVGVAITNTDYWTPIFTLNFAQANNNITLRDDSNNVLSTFTSVIGDWLLWNGTLYKVIADIGLSQAYLPGYNIERYTVELFIKDYIDGLKNIIGDLNDLTTTDKTSVVNAINEVLTTLQNVSGDLNDLNTTDKTNLVSAINEVLTTLQNVSGDLDNLTTTDKTNLVSAINEVVGNVSDVKDHVDNMRIYNVLDYGATGDGVTDDTSALNVVVGLVNATGGIVYFPRGAYKISDTLHFTHHATTIRGGGQQSTFIKQTVNRPAVEIGSGSPTLNIASRVEDIGFTYDGAIFDTNTIALYLNWCVNATVNNVVVGGFQCGFQLTKVGNSFLTECGVSATNSGAVGFNIGEGSVSTKVSSCYVGFTGASADDGIGLVMNRGDIADICIEYFDVGNGLHAILLDGADSPADLPPADIRLHDIVSDGARNSAIKISNITAQGNVIIDGGWLNIYRSSATAGIRLATCNNVTITNITIQQLLNDTPSPYGIGITSGSYIKIADCNFINLLGALSLSSVDYLTIVNNSIRLYSGQTSVSIGVMLASCYHVIMTENELYGSYGSGAVLLDASGDYSIVKNNIIQGTITDNHTNKVVSDNM